MTGHHIELTLDSDSGVSAKFTCEEPATKLCRQICDYGCEIYDLECMDNHPRSTVEYCNYVEFVENSGLWWEQYVGEETQPRSGTIFFEWQDDWYGWRYDDEWTDKFEYENVRKPSWMDRLRAGFDERNQK